MQPPAHTVAQEGNLRVSVVLFVVSHLLLCARNALLRTACNLSLHLPSRYRHMDLKWISSESYARVQPTFQTCVIAHAGDAGVVASSHTTALTVGKESKMRFSGLVLLRVRRCTGGARLWPFLVVRSLVHARMCLRIVVSYTDASGREGALQSREPSKRGTRRYILKVRRSWRGVRVGDLYSVRSVRSCEQSGVCREASTGPCEARGFSSSHRLLKRRTGGWGNCLASCSASWRVSPC